MSECEECARQKKRFNALLVDVENAEMDLRAARRKIKSLERQIAEMNAPEHLDKEAERVFLYWREELRSASKRKVVFGEKRKTKVCARLRDGYTVDDLKLAIDGARDHAFVDEKGKRHDDLELICRDEVKVDSFISRAEGGSAGSPAQPAPTPLVPKDGISRDAARNTILDALWAQYSSRMFEEEAMEWWVAPCPACQVEWSTLRVRTNDMNPLVSCERCNITTGLLLQAIQQEAQAA